VRSAWGFTERERLIGYVGRYSGEKYAEAAALAVAALGEPYHAVYAGEGWMEDSLRGTVHQIAGHRARFVPMDRQVGNILHALDAFVLASPSEGFSLALAEAWYCGVPTIATRVGAVPELERRHGRLVSEVSVRAGAQELASAVREALSPEFETGVVKRAAETVSHDYTAGVMGRRWTGYLCSIAADRRRDPIGHQAPLAASA
jgi:glycosyltransferase involved in cell wall biosynthesis